MPFERAAGVLLHPTSLPGPWGIGDIGPAAHRYLDWLARAEVRWWQVLPLNPTGGGSSPYSATSAFAGNVGLVSPDALRDDGLLADDDLADAPRFAPGTTDYGRAYPFKEEILDRSWQRFAAAPSAALAAEFERFRDDHAAWLSDYTAFASLKRHHRQAPWWRWPRPLALADAAALESWRRDHADELASLAWRQFLFFRQWDRLRARAGELGIRILGDMPIFVARDSCDVWAHRDLFRLDPDGSPTVVAGVPPDYFSADGQLWGNPLYAWDRMADRGYAWWTHRIAASIRLVDALRLDHFRGFAAAWEVPSGETTAKNGRWSPGPGRALFDAVRAALGDVPLVAEDLGLITEDVTALRDELGLPGMAVLQFAFQPHPRSLFLPYFHQRNLVVYTGTHDNNTTAGWYRDEAPEEVRDFVRRYCASDGKNVHWDLIRLALGSVADLAVVPHQDVLGLGAEHRMNTPGVAHGNWRFRLTDDMLADGPADGLAELVRTFGRTPDTAKPG